MDEITALHTAARHYCLERDAYTLVPDLRQLRPLVPEDQWPRLKLLPAERWAEEMASGAILLDVERVVPSDFASIAELRTFLLTAARTIEVYPITNPTARYDQLVAEARESFQAYIAHLSPHDLHAIEPLPYRRVLTPPQWDRLWHRFVRRWGAHPDQWWYPLNGEPIPANVMLLQRWAFCDAILQEVLQGLFRQQHIERLWELRRQWRLDQYEMDPALLELQGPQANEVFSTAGAMDWLLYSSHEGSLTAAGEWLVAAIKATWPAWEQHVFVHEWHE